MKSVHAKRINEISYTMTIHFDIDVGRVLTETISDSMDSKMTSMYLGLSMVKKTDLTNANDFALIITDTFFRFLYRDFGSQAVENSP